MKPNQCSAVLDWKLEAVSTRIYRFLSFSPAPSFFSAQTLPLSRGSKGFILQQGLRCAIPDARVQREGHGLLGIRVFTDLVSSLYS